jgi:hypothetical protein
MPYLEKGVRASLQEGRLPMKPGELNYVISSQIDAYITRHGLGYGIINEVMGVLSCVQAEIYRRIAAGYEDKKARENGEVFLNV